MSTLEVNTTHRAIDGAQIEILQAGSGKTLLYLQSVDGVDPQSAWLANLAAGFGVIAPSHPGFGHSELPEEFRTVGDLAFFYLELIRELEIEDAVLVGSSFGGWLAAEIAIRSTEAFSHAVLVDPVGIKTGGREDRDIADVFAVTQDELARMTYRDPAPFARDYSALSDEQLLGIARSREAHAYFGWAPFMHNPTLRRWLRRLRLPTLVIWGADDGIVSPDYGRAFAAELPQAFDDLLDAAAVRRAAEQRARRPAAPRRRRRPHRRTPGRRRR